MFNIKSIQLKATVLLIIFSLNMVVGFACSVGVDMGFNAHHHDEAEAIHIHKDGSKHHHEKKEHKHSDHDKKDNCCNDTVLKITQTDKAIPQVVKVNLANFDTYFIHAYYDYSLAHILQVSNVNKYYLHCHHPPPVADIRIAIQSFQI